MIQQKNWNDKLHTLANLNFSTKRKINKRSGGQAGGSQLTTPTPEFRILNDDDGELVKLNLELFFQGWEEFRIRSDFL